MVAAEHLPAVAAVLKTDARLRFDLLRCLSAVDWPAQNSIELSYDLMSTALGHAFAVKVVLDRANPQVESVGDLWPAAQWHEREAFDLLGVTFLHHPDLVEFSCRRTGSVIRFARTIRILPNTKV